MAKTEKRSRFWLAAVVYAVVFLGLTAVGLTFFWDFIESYELSRPKHAADAYVAQLTVEDLCEASEQLFSGIDPKLQTHADCCRILEEAVTEPITCAKQASRSDEHSQRYVLRSGKQVIGSFTMEPAQKDRFGFTPWELTGLEADFSYLLGAPLSITVPEDAVVRANAVVLDDSYITRSGIEYPLLAEFYADYDLPTMVTYSVENYLGELSLVAEDRQGKSLQQEEDPTAFLERCTEKEAAELTPFVTEFLGRYITFCSSSNKAVTRNFSKLSEYLVPDGELVQRLWSAVEGLRFAQSLKDTVTAFSAEHLIRLGEGWYLCDISYTLETVSRSGTVQTTNRMKVIVVETTGGLRVEAMTSY